MMHDTSMHRAGPALQPARCQDGRPAPDDAGSAGTITVTRPAPPRVHRLPPWKVLLHNDDVNEMGFVINTVIEICSITQTEATVRTLEAHHSGVALLLTTHREHAELLQEQLTSKKLTVTIEAE